MLDDMDAAQQAAQSINDGTDFAVVLGELNRTMADADLGMVERSGLVDPAVADAAFGLEAGKAAAVEGRFGPVLVRVGEIAPAGSNQSLYEEARLLNHVYSVVDGAIQHGAPVRDKDGVVRFVGKGLKEIIAQVDTELADWIRYAVAKSANELRKQGRENLFSKDEIDYGLSLENDRYKQTFEDWLEFNNRIVDFAEKFGGIIDPKFRNNWKRRWYLPFYRVGQRGGKMKARKFGRIIVISSINGQKGQFAQVNYAATKAGDLGIIKSLAQEGARAGITANAVCPGYIATEMVMAVPEKVRESIIGQIPAGRLGEPEEIARCVTFLASDEAGFINGSTISANGAQFFG